MSVFSRNYLRAVQEGRDDFWADGRIWSVAELQKIRCAPASIPDHVKASLEGSTPQAKPQAKATPKPASVNPYLVLAKATPEQFRQEVERLMQETGCTRLEAARLLSQASGLSEQRQSSGRMGRFNQMKREYFNR